VVPHAGTILTTTTPDKNDAVLLDVVAFTGNVGRDDFASRQAHTRRLTFTGVGLLGLCNADLHANALEHGGLDGTEGGRDGMALRLGFAAALGR